MTGAAATSLPIFVAGAIASKEPLVVSVHDVAPATRQQCAEIIAEVGRRGVTACSLLVVPNYHRTGESCQDREFVRWLRELEERGHEIVIHGYFHERPRGENETIGGKFLTRYYTRGEGEFYDLPYDEAFRRITKARDSFKAAGLTPRGFIAPAWLLGSEAEQALADAELEYTTRLTTVDDLRTGRRINARSLVYSVENAWRRTTSLAWNGMLARLLADNPLLRLSLHPPDIRHASIWRQVTSLVEMLVETRSTTTYCDWVGQWRIRHRT